MGIRSRLQYLVVRSRLLPLFRHRLLKLNGKIKRLMRNPRFAEDAQTYELMRQDNRSSPSLYQAGKFWDRLNRQHVDLIWGGGLVDLRNQYFNRTFAGPEPESRQVYRALLFLYYQKIREMDVDNFLETESEPVIGGAADQEIFFGRAFSLDFLQSVEEAYRIRQAWQMSGKSGFPNVIVELGAGYGRLAYVCRKMMPDCSYVILDLPEALTCASSWLSRVLPEKEVIPYAISRNIENFSREDFLKNKVWTLGAHQIERIEDGAIDAFVNIYSFAEMPKESIDNYFSHIDRLTHGVFYSKQRIFEKNKFDNVNIGKKDYPVKKNWRLLYTTISSLYDNFDESAYVVNHADA